jgi:hypothetical protein
MTLNTQKIDMPRKIFSPEQIIAKLRQIEVLIGQDNPWPRRFVRPESVSRATTVAQEIRRAATGAG